MFKAVLLGNTLQFRVVAEIFQGGFVVFQQQFSKVHFEAATTHNAHHHDVGGFTAESEGRNLLLLALTLFAGQVLSDNLNAGSRTIAFQQSLFLHKHVVQV